MQLCITTSLSLVFYVFEIIKKYSSLLLKDNNEVDDIPTNIDVYKLVNKIIS